MLLSFLDFVLSHVKDSTTIPTLLMVHLLFLGQSTIIIIQQIQSPRLQKITTLVFSSLKYLLFSKFFSFWIIAYGASSYMIGKPYIII